MYLVLIFAILCAGAALISLKFNKKIEETFSLWIFIIIFILYLFGILGRLKIGVYVVITIGLISVMFCCYSIYHNKQNFIDNILTPGFAMFIIFFLLVWWGQKGRLFITGDEFSHWGLVVKNMNVFDAFGNYPAATTQYRGYPPATALFEYFWVKLSGSFTENNLYRSMNILYFSLMMPIFRNLKWKNIGEIILRTILVLILPLVFYQSFYTTILVDGMLGIMFAYILIYYFENEMSTFKIFNLSFSLFVLTLIKASGFALALIAVIVMAIDILYIKKQDLKQYINRDKNNTTIRKITVLFPMLFTLIAKYSWSLYLSITKTNVAWNTSKIQFQSFINLFNGNAPQYQKDTISNFFTSLSNCFLTDYTFKISFICWILILIVISIILIDYICNNDERIRFKVAAINVFIGAAIYTLALLILYVFTYSKYEAVELACFARYIDTYLLGILVFFIVTICLKEKAEVVKHKILYSTGILLSLLLITRTTPILNITLLAYSNINSTIVAREIYKPTLKINHIVNPKTNKLYIISIGDNGNQYLENRYIVTPIKTNTAWNWSLGKPYYKGDIWTKNIDVNKWAKELKKDYTYVYIFRTNSIFNKNYGKIFDGGSKAVKNATLYFVNKKNNKIVLKKVK